jgi:hypothetical protein
VGASSSSLLPGNSARKLVGGAVLMEEFYMCNCLVGNPKKRL